MSIIVKALRMLLTLSLLTGLLYPLLITGIGNLVFPRQARGSLIYDSQGRPVGSELVAQAFTKPGYFWPRPSATSPSPYNAASSGASNLGPTAAKLQDATQTQMKALGEPSAGAAGAVPVDLATCSGSGLDPHISPEAALYQAPRVAQARNLPVEQVRSLVQSHIEAPQLGFLGQPRVNVLKLNLALDAFLTRP